MLNRAVPPSATSLLLRIKTANDWLMQWQGSATHRVLASIEANRLSLHSVTTGAWVVSVNWGAESIVVSEAQGECSSYRFTGMKSALAFLDALLLNHVAKLADLQAVATASESPLADAS